MLRFKTKPGWDENQVAERISHIVGAEGSSLDTLQPPWKRDGKWQLDRGNDWFLEKIGENEYELRFRYKSQVAVESLAEFLRFVFE